MIRASSLKTLYESHSRREPTKFVLPLSRCVNDDSVTLVFGCPRLMNGHDGNAVMSSLIVTVILIKSEKIAAALI